MLFPTTHWSLLAKASANGDAESAKALEELCGQYREPICAFIRSRRLPESDTEDLAHEFLIHLMQKSTFRRADPARGRFRSFLLGSLVRFLGDKTEARMALKRGGAVEHVALMEDRAEAQASSDLGHEVLMFDREWALTILERALKRIREESGSDSTKLALLKQFLPGAAEQPTYEEAARRLGVSVAALKSDIHRLRHRFRALMRQEVAETVSAPHEIEEEIEHLRRVLMDPSNEF
jgi:RNA polymerase sigma-70 factor (ECF subfamily)